MANAQLRSNLRRSVVPTRGEVVLEDSLSVIPYSLSIAGIDSSFYTFDALKSTIYWRKKHPLDSVKVTYRVFNKLLTMPYRRLSYRDYIDVRYGRSYLTNQKEPSDNYFDFGNVEYTGSFGRTVSAGNNQDLIFNSQFNLRMNGYLGDSVKLIAALTDNNLPIQPDGSTQLLSDFDRIFLQFSKKKWEISLGDIELQESGMYFLNFYKRLQGMSYKQDWGVKDITNESLVNVSLAKGKFAVNRLVVTEGNQGPYRLYGNNNELYLIVLAGTERVYVDGELMVRGEDGDYIIDYNLAQISFTPKRMMNKDKRVRVEFEYSDRNYLNAMVFARHKSNVNKKWKIDLGVYSNADSKSSPINVSIDAEKKKFLNIIGDRIDEAYYPYAEQVTYTSSKILYAKKDTILNGFHDSIYVYSTDSLQAKYFLHFTLVGNNKGNYIPLQSGANGQVFQWVSPLNGVPQGNYEPAEFIPTPKAHGVIALNNTYYFDEHTSLALALATSRYDVNTFSTNDKHNDNGFAGKLSFEKKIFLSKGDSAQKELTTAINFERVDKRFKPVERLRSVEFARDWALGADVLPEDEYLLELRSVLKTKAHVLRVSLEHYNRSDGYRGYRPIGQYQWRSPNGWDVNSLLQYTKVDGKEVKGFFARPNISISKRFPQWKNISLGGTAMIEHTQLSHSYSDSLTRNSFAFEQIGVFLKSDPAKNSKLALEYYTRNNRLPIGTRLVLSDRSHNISVGASLLDYTNHMLRFTTTFRHLQVFHTDVFRSLKPENSFLGRVEYDVNEWQGLVHGSILYETGSGQEQKRAYSYVEVPAGQGQFKWIDYNKDGIAQINEFEVANYSDEGKFIKIFTPTNEFVKANYVQFNYSVAIDPSAYFTETHTRWQKLLSKLNIQSSLQAGQKSMADKHISFNPLQGNIADSSLLNLNYTFNNTLSINRRGSIWGFDISRYVNYGKALLTYGSERWQLAEWVLKGRLNFLQQYTLEMQQKIGDNYLHTPFFANRNYEISSFSSMPSLSFFLKTTFRLSGSYHYLSMRNKAIYGNEKYTGHTYKIETKYNALKNGSVTGTFSYNQINYQGETNSTVGYTMLQGLMPGKNFVWSIDLSKRFMKTLEFTLRYEGRKPDNTRVIHVGRAGVRAIL